MSGLLSTYVQRSQITVISASQVQFAATEGLAHRPIKLSSPSGRSASLAALPTALTISGSAGTKYVFAHLLPPPTTEYGGGGGLIQADIGGAVPWLQTSLMKAFRVFKSDDGAHADPATNSPVELVMSATEAPPDTHHLALGHVVWSGSAITGVTTYSAETGGTVSLGGNDYIDLWIPNVDFPDGTGTLNGAGLMDREVSTGTQTANTPKRTQTKIQFAASLDQTQQWTFFMRPNYGTGGTLHVILKAFSATAGNASIKASIQPTVDLSTDDDAAVFNPVSSTIWTPPGTQGQTQLVSIPLVVTNVLASRKCTIMFGRDGTGALATDTMAGALELCAAGFEYTKAS